MASEDLKYNTQVTLMVNMGIFFVCYWSLFFLLLCFKEEEKVLQVSKDVRVNK